TFRSQQKRAGARVADSFAAKSRDMKEAFEIYTCGHSTRSWRDFVALLKAYAIEQLIDVRSLPGSNKYPHFNADRMKRNLKTHKIAYQHMPGLGGRRKAQPVSKNTAWRNKSFRAYADHM